MVQGVIIQNNQIQNHNPSNGDLISQTPCTTPTQLQQVVSTAVQTFPKWSATPLEERINLLKNAIRALEDVQDDLSQTITKEMGKPHSEAKEEVAEATDKDSFLDLVRMANEEQVFISDELDEEKEWKDRQDSKKLLLENDDQDKKKKGTEEEPQTKPNPSSSSSSSSHSIVIRDPLGVVAVLSPWNFPADEILLLVLPALAAGNTVIVKPSEVVPLTGQMVIDALCTVLPPGVIQCVQGDGVVGEALVSDPNIDMVAMTGSTEVGKQIMKTCAGSLKRLVLELGGKDPMIVFRDADLNKAAQDAVTYSLSNSGQVCCSFERVYVDEAVKEQFHNNVLDIVKQYKVGDGMNEHSRVGPLVTKMQRDKVAKQVDAAVQDGAKILYQSDVPPPSTEQNQTNHLYSFYPITVLTDLSPKMNIQHDETFGPVISISTFDGSESEAVKVANDTRYGLTSAVYTNDLDKAKRVGRGIRSGQVGINCYSLEKAHMKCPWVGHKESGFGYHSGVDGFRQFSVPKSLVFP